MYNAGAIAAFPLEAFRLSLEASSEAFRAKHAENHGHLMTFDDI